MYRILLVGLLGVIFLICGGNCWSNESSTEDHFNRCPIDSKLYRSGRMFRDLPLIGDEEKYLRAKREPRMFTFTTNNKDVDIKMEFGVPFITIPIKRTIAGLKNFATNAMQGNLPAPANINPMSIIFIALFSLGMTTTAFSIWATNRRQYLLGTAPYIFRSNDVDEGSDIPELENLWKLLRSIDKTLAKFNIDTNVCMQKTVCEVVQRSMVEVNRRGDDANVLNTVLEGITRSDWAMKYVRGSAIGDAVVTAREGKSCSKVFTSCRVNFNFVRNIFQVFENKI